MNSPSPRSDRHARDQIATALDQTLVVEAAAGTGKTTELVGRIVRVIETGRAAVTEIVAVTFTEKAAGELKLRLREALEEARRNAAAGSAERARLDESLRRLEEAQVSTIHGFCADVLRERPVEAGIDPLFAVLTEAQAARTYDTAFQSWFQEQLVDPPEAIQRALLRSTFAGFGAPSFSEDGPVDRLRQAGYELTKWRDFDGEWQRAPFDRQSRVEVMVQQLHAFVELLSHPANPGDNLYYDTRPARQLSEDVRRTEAAAPRDHNRLEAALIDLARHRQFQRARKGSGKIYRPGLLREDAWRMREDFQHALERFEADANADLAALLHTVLRGCVDRYHEAKARAGSLDFLDLLLEARNLIRDHGDVRRSFQQRFTRIFVDEFQDTDPLQAEILLLLAADDPSLTDWRHVRPVPGKLFLVGDPKQSIYRFRRADVGIYRDVYEMLQRSGATRVTLSTSFRARPNIQRAINAAFAPILAGDDVALQARYVPLEPFRPDAGDQPSVVVLPVPKPYATQRIANTSIEASLPDAVGAFVEWLVRESGWKVAERPMGPGAAVTGDGDRTETAALGFKPGEKEQLVPIQARHVCLLFRRFVSYDQDMTRPYVEALEAREVPHLLVGGRSFHNRAEIETLRAALAAIEWPDDELSVFATLRGALFAIGDEELLEYRDRFKHIHPFRVPKPDSLADATKLKLGPTAPKGDEAGPAGPVGPSFSMDSATGDQAGPSRGSTSVTGDQAGPVGPSFSMDSATGDRAGRSRGSIPVTGDQAGPVGPSFSMDSATGDQAGPSRGSISVTGDQAGPVGPSFSLDSATGDQAGPSRGSISVTGNQAGPVGPSFSLVSATGVSDDLVRFAPTINALLLLASLHRARNHVPVATTIARLLDATRAHVRFALEHGGEQVLANVLQVAELARRYEVQGGISFRGFIEELRDQAEHGDAGEAPILEEGSDGVRLMTVHKAKGLEFPVVILADMTAKIRSAAASRFIDPDRRVCAIRLAGCSPLDLVHHEAEELQRDEAEGVRVAYVAATRARDLLVVPAVGDQPREGWIEPLNGAIYPPPETRRQQEPAIGCPPFRTKDSVLSRPNGDPATAETVCPGQHTFEAGHHVVWWDPRALSLDAEPPLGIRRPELIVKDVAPRVVEAGMADYEAWRAKREASLAAGAQPAMTVRTATAWAKSGDRGSGGGDRGPEDGERRSGIGDKRLPPVDIIDLPIAHGRPSGRRFGTLVHAVLAGVPLDGDADTIDHLAAVHGRILGATEEEMAAVTVTVSRALGHPLLLRARDAAKAGRCRREVPIAVRDGEQSLIEGVIDLAFEEDAGWTIVDFKTDEERHTHADGYQRQVGLYAAAVQSSTGRPVTAMLVWL